MVLHDQDIVREFLVESYENLDQLDRDLVVLEQQPRSPEALARIFRTLHTLKGTCGFLGFAKLEAVAHVGENLLSRLRDGQLVLRPEITTALLTLVDAIRDILGQIETTGREGAADYSALIDTLTALQAEPPPAAGLAADELAAAEPPASEPAASEPPAAQPPSGELSTSELPAGPAAGEPAAAEPPASKSPAAQPLAAPSPASPPASAGPGPQEPQVPPASPAASPSAEEGEGRAQAVAESTIRVDVGLLDKLMNRVGELVLARNQILQFTSHVSDSALLGACQRLNLITTELQEGVMKTRMQPIGNVWSKFPRVVRDVALLCGKQVRIEMEGKETELDKTILEAIKDPLTHLVRNAIDHGIESPQLRQAAGKPAEGCLRLRAFHEGGQVNIEISDDGAGLNLERIRQKAIERGLISPEQALRMSDREAAQLIFLPGFSTAPQVTHVSGRGVGMDVVKTNIERIGGTVDLHSQPGQGTTIKLKIPLTLAIIPALIVTCDQDRYAIPQVSLLELVRLEGEQARRGIEWLHAAPVYRLRGQLLPLVHLREALGLTPLPQPEVLNIVVLRADERPLGLVVDAINDTEEIVVKPLGKQLKGIPVYAGATIMGDGKVALILDVLGLAQQAKFTSGGRDKAAAEAPRLAEQPAAQRQTLLVVGLGEGRRAAIPLELVGRLEEIEASRIELADGAEVVQYRGCILPLVRLAQVLGHPHVGSQAKPTLQVVVYSEQGQSVGLVVDRILDIVEVSLALEREATRQGVRGSAVIQDRVTDLVDVRSLVSAALGRPFSTAVAV
jgi:two-component system chemotaxis sensor kinase CheA